MNPTHQIYSKNLLIKLTWSCLMVSNHEAMDIKQQAEGNRQQAIATWSSDLSNLMFCDLNLEGVWELKSHCMYHKFRS